MHLGTLLPTVFRLLHSLPPVSGNRMQNFAQRVLAIYLGRLRAIELMLQLGVFQTEFGLIDICLGMFEAGVVDIVEDQFEKTRFVDGFDGFDDAFATDEVGEGD